MWGQQVIMSSSHKWPLCPPLCSLTSKNSLKSAFQSLIPQFLYKHKFVLLAFALLANLNLQILVPPLVTPGMEKAYPVPSWPYGWMDRSEKEHRDLVALNFLQDVIFTDAEKLYWWLLSFFNRDYCIKKNKAPVTMQWKNPLKYSP